MKKVNITLSLFDTNITDKKLTIKEQLTQQSEKEKEIASNIDKNNVLLRGSSIAVFSDYLKMIASELDEGLFRNIEVSQVSWVGLNDGLYLKIRLLRLCVISGDLIDYSLCLPIGWRQTNFEVQKDMVELLPTNFSVKKIMFVRDNFSTKDTTFSSLDELKEEYSETLKFELRTKKSKIYYST